MENRRYFFAFLLIASVLLLSSIRAGDLAGYDDALFAHMAKAIVRTGDWTALQSRGEYIMQHPPMLPWMQAALFSLFHISDAMAKLPAALCGIGVVALTYFVGLELAGPFAGLLAMFVMMTSAYFLKYAAHAMTDVPFTFFFLGAIYCWIRAERDDRWYFAAGVFTACAQMTRGLMGLALPAVFLVHLIVSRRRAPLSRLVAALVIAFAPVTLWYAHGFYVVRHAPSLANLWLQEEVYGELTPAWRRYTGIFEYAWMLTKSYWPWLPASIAGLVVVIRSRDRRLALLTIWTAVVFLLCGAAKSRVLRYMLPAYPAYAVLAAIGLARYVSEKHLRRALAVLTPLLAVGYLTLAIFPKVERHAEETRPIALAATSATPLHRSVGFYDDAQPRFDEANQLQWYGERDVAILLTREQLIRELHRNGLPVFVIDSAAYNTYVAGQIPNRVIAVAGHLVCFRTTGAAGD